MTGFTPDDDDQIPFSVDLSGGGTALLLPEVGDDGVRTWSGDIILADGTDSAALRAEQVRVTARPAIGRLDHGSLIMEGLNVGGVAGRFGDLEIPTEIDDTGVQVWRAALTAITLRAEGFSSKRRASVTFIVGNRVS